MDGHHDEPRAQFKHMEEGTAEDWKIIGQAFGGFAKELPDRVITHLQLLEGDCGGFPVDRLTHCLQTATLAHRDGQDEETIVVSLFHDLGFVTNNETHGEFAAQFLRPYVSEKNVWMLERHMYFQTIHLPTYPDIDTEIRERWRGHEWFEWAADWVRKYDIASIDAAAETAPLSVFEPMVYRVFSRPPREMPVPE